MVESGENGEWMTYEEAASRLDISTEAVRALARRRKWPRQSPNAPGGRARVLIPGMTRSDRPRPALPDGHGGVPDGQVTGLTDGQVTGDSVDDQVGARAVESAITTLQAELGRRIDIAEAKVNELQAALTAARAAEGQAVGEAAALRSVLDRLEQRVAYLDQERRQLLEILLRPPRGWRKWFR